TEAVYLDTAVWRHGILSTDFADGDGTEDDPYQIATAEQLNNVRKYPDAHFMLIADIDLDKPPYNQGEGWEPIGTSSNPFNGKFDGNNYRIQNLFIDRSDQNGTGLFGVISNGAEIHNVG